jgi:lipid A 4'-phosphatase
VPILAINRRKFGILISILFGTIIGMVRILQGGHFFSDVLFAGIIVWFVAELVHYLFKNKTYSN